MFSSFLCLFDLTCSWIHVFGFIDLIVSYFLYNFTLSECIYRPLIYMDQLNYFNKVQFRNDYLPSLWDQNCKNLIERSAEAYNSEHEKNKYTFIIIFEWWRPMDMQVQVHISNIPRDFVRQTHPPVIYVIARETLYVNAFIGTKWLYVVIKQNHIQRFGVKLFILLRVRGQRKDIKAFVEIRPLLLIHLVIYIENKHACVFCFVSDMHWPKHTIIVVYLYQALVVFAVI